jgi:hypothetical protein
MFEVEATYVDESVDTVLCESKPSLSTDKGFVFLDCGKGQKLAANIESLVCIKISYPLPDSVPLFKYQVDIHYDTQEESVELLFSSSNYYVATDGDDGFTPVVLVKEGDNVIRIINSEYLRSIKVNAHSEK